MEEIYAIADLFLLPSEYESFGLSALEAMAAGTPVVATNSGGLPEIVTHGLNGYLSNIGDVESMGNFSKEILRNEKTHKAFKIAAREQALRFDIENIVPLYENLYQKVLDNNKP
jgi:glycosyltransferase involved in cell wall biosynthesis